MDEESGESTGEDEKDERIGKSETETMTSYDVGLDWLV